MIGGNNSEMIELNPEHVLVLRVIDHRERAPQPLSAVKDVVSERLRAEQAREAAQQKGEQLVAKLEGGATLASLADELGLDAVDEQQIGRDERSVRAALVEHLFSMPHPGEGSPVYDKLVLPDGGLALFALSRVSDGEMADLNEIGGEEAVKNAMLQSRGKRYFEHFQSNLREQAEIKIMAEAGAE